MFRAISSQTKSCKAGGHVPTPGSFLRAKAVAIFVLVLCLRLAVVELVSVGWLRFLAMKALPGQEL